MTARSARRFVYQVGLEDRLGQRARRPQREEDAQAEREALRKAVECPLCPHEGDGGVE